MIGVSFASDRLGECCKFSEPITEQSKAKPMQHQITFNWFWFTTLNPKVLFDVQMMNVLHSAEAFQLTQSGHSFCKLKNLHAIHIIYQNMICYLTCNYHLLFHQFVVINFL